MTMSTILSSVGAGLMYTFDLATRAPSHGQPYLLFALDRAFNLLTFVVGLHL